MIYTKMTKEAMKIAYEAHKDAVDKGGVPYVFHPIHVAEAMTDELSTCAALLHDVLEDTAMTAEELLARGISQEAVRCVEILTRRESEPYEAYIRRIRQNPTAVQVKLADLAHNSDMSRLSEVTQKDFARGEMYRQAAKMLEA